MLLRTTLLCCLAAITTATDYQAWVTTAAGAGADAVVEAGQPNQGKIASMSVRSNEFPTHTMKSYLRFDLRKLEREPAAKGKNTLKQVDLVLTLVGKPDAERIINVFGLVERPKYGGDKKNPVLGEDWDESLITLANGPANSPYSGGPFVQGDKEYTKDMLGGVNHDYVSLLGELKIPKDAEGTATATLKDMETFLAKSDKNKLITVILCQVNSSPNPITFATKESGADQSPKLGFVME